MVGGLSGTYAQSSWGQLTPNITHARAYALAGAYGASVNESSANFYNPGALGTIRNFTAGASGYVQILSSSFDEDDAPSYINFTTIDERKAYIKPSFLGFALPLGDETGVTASFNYMRLFDWSFQETWDISSDGPDDEFVIEEAGGINDFSFGIGKAWNGNSEIGFGSSIHYLRGSSAVQIDQNGTTTDDYTASYSGWMFRHGFVVRDDDLGLGLVYENPWERRRFSDDEILGDSVYSLLNFGQQFTVSAYAGGSSTRFHVQYEYRQVKHQANYFSTSYSQMDNVYSFENRPNWSISLALEVGDPGESGVVYSFRYAKYPFKLGGDDVNSLMGSMSFGGPVGNDLFLGINIGMEYFPTHKRVTYGGDGELIHRATYWRLGFSLDFIDKNS